MICKRCQHPSWTHNETTGKCDAVNHRIIREYDDIFLGFPRYICESEIVGDCDCNRKGCVFNVSIQSEITRQKVVFIAVLR
jgi:hypothetical protein